MYYTSVQLFFVKPQRTHLESGEKSLFPKIFNLINCSTKIERHRLFMQKTKCFHLVFCVTFL